MTDPNIQRGQSNFEMIISSSMSTLNADSCEILQLLKAHYLPLVGIMPTNGLYSAKRMADACVTASAEASSLEESIALAEQIYTSNANKTAQTFRLNKDDAIKNRGKSFDGYSESGNTSHDETTKVLGDFIDSGATPDNVESFFVEDESGEVREFKADVIDLIDDAREEGELSIEGMRAVGIIDLSFDTTKNSVDEKIITSANQLTTEESNHGHYDSGFLTILCPNCKTDKIYPMGENMFGCFDCDNEFKFKHNLNDIY